MRSFLTVLFLAVQCLTVLAEPITNLNPRSVVAGKVIGGDIPSGYSNVVYSMWNGAWVSSVNLPPTAPNGAKLNIVIYSSWPTLVFNTNTDIPQASYKLTKDTSLGFEYVEAKKRWEVIVPTVEGNNSMSPLQINTPQNVITRVRLSDSAWNPAVVLPPKAADGSAVLVSSKATKTGKIDSTNLLFPYTTSLGKDSDYAFIFNASLGKWLLLTSPETLLTLNDLNEGSDIPTPRTAMTRLTLEPGSKAGLVRLPASGNQRDRIIIKSQADTRSNISILNDTSKGTMTIGKGETYEFMWDDNLKSWQVLQAPVTRLKAANYADQALPTTTTTMTIVEAWDGNWASAVNLPNQATTHDRVVVKSSAPNSMVVMGVGMSQQTISNGEEVVFVFNASKAWERETSTIRVLMTMGQGLVNKLGLSAAQLRQMESLRITNETLSNSGNKFRLQLASLLTVPDFGKDLNTAIYHARSNSLIQGERNRVAADAVYYEGIEAGCGLAYVLPKPNSYSMMSAGSLNCGTVIMRHELAGHNMGLNHGNGFYPTAMSGNRMPYFATPFSFSSTLLPISYKAYLPDEVNLMDKNAPAVAKFR